jgi:acyl transferase domain-containing protein
MMQSLRLLDVTDGQWLPSPRTAWVFEIPEDVSSLLEAEMPVLLADSEVDRLTIWLDKSCSGWDVGNRLLADLIDGVLVVPLMIAIQQAGGPQYLEGTGAKANRFSEPVVRVLREWFSVKGWSHGRGDGFRLTGTGRFLIDRALLNGVPASYSPMLRRIEVIIFGSAKTVFGDLFEVGERHVERPLNVAASGFQHKKYFADLARMVRSRLDMGDFSVPPSHIVDVGCGDGTLLKTVYEAVRDHPAYSHSSSPPSLTLVAADPSRAALQAASLTLGDAPHVLLEARIEDPLALMESLGAGKAREDDRVLHIRSFVDHDRGWHPPPGAANSGQFQLAARGTYADHEGNIITGERAAQLLVEHLGRWGQVVGEHGLVVLEVHAIAPEILASNPETTNSVHFDALHGFSQQQLVEADTFLLAAAQAGLLPRAGYFKRYPRFTAYTHITLSWFCKRPFVVRRALAADLDALVGLEEACWTQHLRTPATDLASRLERCPEGNLVVELNGTVRAVIYSQRLDSTDALLSATAGTVGRLHSPDGPVAQLIALNVHPDFLELGLGDQLLTFLLQYSSVRTGIGKVAGVTRCMRYPKCDDLALEAYICKRDAEGRRVDPLLRFHEQHGAKIVGLVPSYRPEDEDNAGNGVLIEYDLGIKDSFIQAAPKASTGERGRGSVSDRLHAMLRRVLDVEALPDSVAGIPFTELGCDSLQLQELLLMLCEEFGKPLDPTFFFRYGTIESASKVLQPKEDGRPNKRPPAAVKQLPQELASSPKTASSEAGRSVDRIAVIGVGCRFPGSVRNPAEFWRLLAEGRDAVRMVPADRWDIDELYDPNWDAPGKMWSREGGFLDDIDRFDADFFGITPREAMSLDPQQRLLLEVTWEAMENAGVAPPSLAGTQTGVFIGLTNLDYQRMAFADRNEIDAYCATGTFGSTCSGRLSYFLDIHGPSLTVDTACSSSLVAFHLACQSLLAGESDLAIAGGVNLLFPEYSINYTKARMLSPHSRCKTFDMDADGFVRGEGCGVLILKPLSKAQTDGDQVLAVVLATGVNQDGKSNGLTAPNGLAQEELLRQVVERAGVAPRQVSYVEAHGTGTPLGDPVEVEALAKVFGQDRDAASPLFLGSVKTNIGHLEAASGIAGMIKTILALQHRMLPAHLHINELNDRIRTHGVPVAIPQKKQRWAPVDGRYIAGVSSYGFSGTNAHVLLESAPQLAKLSGPAEGCQHVLCVSARRQTDLRALAARYESFLADCEEAIGDVCFTANNGRAHFSHRVAVTGSSLTELREGLAAFLDAPSNSYQGAIGKPSLAMLFSGQGSQYSYMGRELFQTQPTFRGSLLRCDEILRPVLNRSILSVLFPEDGESLDLINQSAYTQPALFAFEYSLFDLWRSWGVLPDVVLGHSIGEYVAACAAGVFSLEDGLWLMAQRGRLMQSLPTGGKMAAVFASAKDVEAALADWPNELAVAAVNTPLETVISGAGVAVESVVSHLRSQGINSQLLTVRYAFHSPLVEGVKADLRAATEKVQYAPPRLPIISNLTGRLYDDSRAVAPGYWVDHMCKPVMFLRALQTAEELGTDVFLEVGPAAILTAMGRRSRTSDSHVFLASLNPGFSDRECLAKCAAALYAVGKDIDWKSFEAPDRSRRVPLPTYPFQRERYWLDERASRSKGAKRPLPGNTVPALPLLGRRVRSPLKEWQFERHISQDCPAFIAHHRVRGHVVLPAAAYLELALTAGRENGFERCSVHEFAIHHPLHLADDQTTVLQTILQRLDGKTIGFSCFAQRTTSIVDGCWLQLATGTLSSQSDVPDLMLADLNVNNRCNRSTDGATFYTDMNRRGYDYGPAFQAVSGLLQGTGCALANIELPVECGCDDAPYSLHPVIADACLQAVASSFLLGPDAVYLPTGWKRFSFKGWSHERGSLYSAFCTQVVGKGNSSDICADVYLFDHSDHCFAVWEGLRLQPLSSFRDAPREEATSSSAPAPLSAGAARSDEGGRLIERKIREALAEILALPNPDVIDPDADLFDFGVDSLMAMDVQIAIEKMVGKRALLGVLSEHRTLRQLKDYVMKETCPDLPPPASGAPELEALLRPCPQDLRREGQAGQRQGTLETLYRER